VIATTLLNQLILFQGGMTPIARRYVDNKQFILKWCFRWTSVRTQYFLRVEQTWFPLHYWTSWYHCKEGRLQWRGDMLTTKCKMMIWFKWGSGRGPSAWCSRRDGHYTVEPVDTIPRREDSNREVICGQQTV